MKRTWVWVVIAAAVAAGWFGWIWQGEEVIDLQNERCPVSGRPVDGAHSYVYKGKRYHLCQEACQGPFSEDPERYAGGDGS